MTKIIKPTNHNLAIMVARDNERVASILDYKKDMFGNESIDDSKLSLFELNPVDANEFINTMSNQIVFMYAYDLFRGEKVTSQFDWALKEMSRIGGMLNYVTNLLDETIPDYAEGGDPFAAPKPNTANNFIDKKYDKTLGKKITEETWAGAFTSEGGLANIVGIILKNMQDSLDNYAYDELCKYVTDKVVFGKNLVVTKINGVGETEAAQKCYEQIMALARKMTLKSKDYNTKGYLTKTPKGSLVLLLNADYMASFDINVLASLFNSSSIALNKIFKRVEVIQFPTSAPHQIGFICDEEALVWGYKTRRMGSIYNPRDMSINYWLNVRVRYGVINGRNAVRLLDTAE